MKTSQPTNAPPEPCGQPAAMPPHCGNAALRAEQLMAFRTAISLGRSPAQVAAELGLSLKYFQRLDRREREHGPIALRPGFQPPSKSRPARPADFSKIGRRPSHGPARFLWDSLCRAFTAGRLLQLKDLGWSNRRACRAVGCPSPSYVPRLQDRIEAGGLLALEIKPPTGRRSTAPEFALRPKVVRRVQVLAVAFGADRAWREFAKRPDCPPRLREWLAGRKNLPEALLKAVRVRVHFIGDSGFTVEPVAFNSKAAA